MADNLVEGCYYCVRGEEMGEFAKKCGFPEEECKKIVGSHWKMRVEKVDGKWVGAICCEEMPEMNNIDSFSEGVEKCMDHPLFGGKAKMIFHKNGDNCFKGTAKTEKFGTLEWSEKYTEDGLTMCWNAKDKGASITEKWCRKVQIEGNYCYDHDENLDGFWKALGFPCEMLSAAKEMKLSLSCIGNKYKMVECFGNEKVTTCYKLDEEVDYAWPNMPPKFNRKIMTTQTGSNKFTTICKGAAGECEEWKSTFCKKGMLYEGLDRKSGQSCKIYLRRTDCVGGTFRLVSTAGYDEFGCAMGLPADIVSKIKNDFAARMSFCEKDGFVRAKLCSKYMPFEVCFKWGEEFEYQFPMVPEKYKLVYTKNGDCVIAVAKSCTKTVRTCAKFTPNFLIQCSEILGTGICTKLIMERC